MTMTSKECMLRKVDAPIDDHDSDANIGYAMRCMAAGATGS